jgi:tRNA threonylcarbamoyladenosine biosynthesis protein TsaE
MSPEIRLRRAEVADAAVVHAITQQAFAELAGANPPSAVLAESERDVVADLAASPGLVVELDGVPVAALRTAPEPYAPTRLRRVRRVSVAPAGRGHALASVLLQGAAEDAAAAGFTALRAAVRTALRHNHAIYDRLGWAVVEGDEDWLSYGLPLPRAVPDADAMRALGRELAEQLRPGDLIVLSGPLGAGKTVVAQGIGAGLGVAERITSPTFVLAREHVGATLPLVHVDAYRLGSLAELDDLDLDTALPNAVTVVEWGAGLVEPLADGHLLVEIERSDDPGDEVRRVTLRAVGKAWAGRQEPLDVDLGGDAS